MGLIDAVLGWLTDENDVFYHFSQRKSLDYLTGATLSFFSLRLHDNIDSKVGVFWCKKIPCRTVNNVSYSRQQNMIHRNVNDTVWSDIHYVIFPLHWPRGSFFSVVFQLRSVQSSGLWPSHYAERSASGRPSATTGCLGLFAQTVLHGLTAAPGLQQVSRPTHITAVSLHTQTDILLLCPSATANSESVLYSVWSLVVVFFILTMNHMTACMWREVSCGDERRKNYHRLCSSYQCIVLVSSRQFYCFVSLTGLIVLFLATEGSCFLQIGF